MESLIVFIVLVAVMVFGAQRTERRAKALNTQADQAIRSLRPVAKKRAQKMSIPLPVDHHWETTGVHDVPTPVPALRVVPDEPVPKSSKPQPTRDTAYRQSKLPTRR